MKNTHDNENKGRNKCKTRKWNMQYFCFKLRKALKPAFFQPIELNKDRIISMLSAVLIILFLFNSNSK